jgi:hypothetical protein
VVNPVVAAAVGIALFGEHFRYGTTGALLAIACGAVAAGGLILLTTERLGAERLVTAAAEAPAGGRSTVVIPAQAKPAGATTDALRTDIASEGSAKVPSPKAASDKPVSTSDRQEPPDSFPAPSALALPLILPLGCGVGRIVEFSGGRPFPGPARRIRSAAGRAEREGSVQTLAPPARR